MLVISVFFCRVSLLLQLWLRLSVPGCLFLCTELYQQIELLIANLHTTGHVNF